MLLNVHGWGDPRSPPLVCLHGVTGHGRRFRKLAEERLAGRFRVLAPDLRGHGGSSWEPPWRLETHLRDVLETVAAAGVERAAWIGHSFGGRLVLELAARAPERLERAILLDPAFEVAARAALEKAEAERLDKSYATVEEAIAKRIETAPLLHTPHEILEEEMREHLLRSRDGRLRYRYCQSAAVCAWGEMASAPPPFASLRAIPALLVVGAESGLVTREQAEGLRRDGGAEVVAVPGGHMVYWDAFAETADAIDAFLWRFAAPP